MFHHPFRGHIYHIFKGFVPEILLHLGDIRHAGFRHFLKLGIVDISSVKGQDIAAVVVGGAEHKGVPLCRRGETNVGGHKLVGMNVGVNFDAALLFPGLRMPPDTFENEIGEERNGRRIDDLQAFDPLWTPASSAVRGKHVLISGV